ncbi:MAG: hypothetical protein QOD06_658 [Candidatus Binatota bacterium]|nr:hypothetical protein [Candidatus Binatota bacterium]
MHDRVGHTELATEGSRDLFEHGFTKDGLMAREHQTQKIRAQPSRSEGAHEDIRIEEDPQEIALKTSSSVR